MHCPTCKAMSSSEVHLKSGAFEEDMVKCNVCGTSWSVNHGMVEIVTDTQARSFLSAVTECVEGDDYNLEFSRG